ncbi:fungal specific transcription factor domain-containing protein [Colletotrichum asianum]|uniref:Fungal specific transcription factor domain-containing protein n=1 Tax=Colletotrichum asianum TaxID=702518 RepID=A0A8H3ZMP1_9PEZI|nr:fungal specific transcription factor domain-containing protein [Colletotrichum asianum]
MTTAADVGAAAARLSKACIECHSRKVECDAPVAGVPCGRYVSKGYPENCKLVSRQQRRSPQRVQNIDELPQAQAEYNGRVHYLSILKTAMSGNERNESVRLGSPATSSANSTPHYPQNPQIGISGLDPVDLEFLMKKGAFVLPHRDSLMVFLTAYFEFVHPYSPVLDKNHFLSSYEAGSYSPFLMQTVLTSATLYVSTDVLTSCGYSNITEAQKAFFNKALLLHDFQCEKSQLCLLQGSLILGTTAFFYPIDRDVHYWFFNAVRLATKLELQRLDQLRIPDVQLRGLYKRFWWVIYCRDVLLSFLGMQSMPLVSDMTKPQTLPTEEDWETEGNSTNTSLPSKVTADQKCHFIEYCKLSVLGTLQNDNARISDAGSVDGEAMAREFHAWRSQLREATGADNQLLDSPYLTSLLAASYRLECILYRTLKLCWKSGDVARHDWARARLRSSMFELDTLFGRALANDQLRNLPMSFNSNIPIALSLHIEAALDATETSANKSMSLIYVRQGMLILQQLQDSPVIKRVLSIFEWALDRVDLNLAAIEDRQNGNAVREGVEPHESVDQVGAAVGYDFEEMFDQMEPWFGDFLGIDFLDNLRSSGDRGPTCEVVGDNTQ